MLFEHFQINTTTGKVVPGTPAQPLSIEFRGEDGIGDGLRREWYMLVVKEVVDVNRGLFSTKDGRTLHPNIESYGARFQTDTCTAFDGSH
jgi:hypothetical protein